MRAVYANALAKNECGWLYAMECDRLLCNEAAAKGFKVHLSRSWSHDKIEHKVATERATSADEGCAWMMWELGVYRCNFTSVILSVRDRVEISS